MEEAVLIKSWENDSSKEHSIQFTNLFHVLICNPLQSESEIREDSKDFLKRRIALLQASLGKLVNYLLGHQKFDHSEHGPTWEAVLKIRFEGCFSCQGVSVSLSFLYILNKALVYIYCTPQFTYIRYAYCAPYLHI